jgi:hypothetical protein
MTLTFELQNRCSNVNCFTFAFMSTVYKCPTEESKRLMPWLFQGDTNVDERAALHPVDGSEALFAIMQNRVPFFAAIA